MKFCKDCKYYYVTLIDELRICKHKKAEQIPDMVTGVREINISCDNMRNSNSKCAKNAKLFKAK